MLMEAEYASDASKVAFRLRSRTTGDGNTYPKNVRFAVSTLTRIQRGDEYQGVLRNKGSCAMSPIASC